MGSALFPRDMLKVAHQSPNPTYAFTFLATHKILKGHKRWCECLWRLNTENNDTDRIIITLPVNYAINHLSLMLAGEERKQLVMVMWVDCFDASQKMYQCHMNRSKSTCFLFICSYIFHRFLSKKNELFERITGLATNFYLLLRQILTSKKVRYHFRIRISFIPNMFIHLISPMFCYVTATVSSAN